MRERKKEVTTQTSEQQNSIPGAPMAPTQAQPSPWGQKGAAPGQKSNLVQAALSSQGADRSAAIGTMENQYGFNASLNALVSQGEGGKQAASERWGDWISAAPIQQKKDRRAALRGQAPAKPSGKGQALPKDVRQNMESAFGQDFSGVEIHPNQGVVQASGAKAFTAGEHIAFAPGQYDPSSKGGKELLAHELTHVVQQRQGRATGAGVLDDPALESHADSMAAKVVSGGQKADEKGKKSAPPLASLGVAANPVQFKREFQSAKFSGNAQLQGVLTDGAYIRQGSRGEAVRIIQGVLKAEKFYSGELDGIFGKGTARALKAYQSDRALSADAIVGRSTVIELDFDAQGPAAAKKETGNKNAAGGKKEAPTGPLASADSRVVDIFSGKNQVDKVKALLKKKKPASFTQADADAFIKLLSEEDIKVLKFNPDGFVRYAKGPDGKLMPNNHQNVPIVFFQAADAQLNHIGAAKGVDDPGSSGLKLDKQIENKLDAQKAYREAVKAITTNEKRHADLMAAAAKEVNPQRRARINALLNQAEANMMANQKKADAALGVYSKFLHKQGKKEALEGVNALRQEMKTVQDAYRAQNDARKARSRARDAQDNAQYRIKYLQSERENVAGNRQQRRARQRQIDGEIKTQKKIASAAQTRAQKAHQTYKAARDGKKAELKKFTDSMKSKVNRGVSVDLVSVGKQLYSKELWAHTVNEMPGPLGAKITGHTKVAMVEANAHAGVSVNKHGVSAHAAVQGKAALVDVNYAVEWTTPDLNWMGETVGFKVYVMVRGFVGAEAKAALAVNLKKNPVVAKGGQAPKLDTDQIMRGTGMSLNNKGKGKYEAAAGANAEAFAGAKLTLGVGAAAEWKKKNKQAYVGKLRSSANALIDIMSMGNPAIGWVMRQMGAEKAVSMLLDSLFAWGAPGTIPIIGLEAAVEGSAGIGAKLVAEVGFSGGKIQMRYAAGATFGLGLAGSVNISIDAVNGIKYALVVMGQLRNVAIDWAKKQVHGILGGVTDIWNDIIDWFTADDKVREAVRHGAHRLVNARERAKMIEACLSGITVDADQAAIVQILKYSKQKGDISRVLRHVSQSWILSDLYGSYDTQARRYMGVR